MLRNYDCIREKNIIYGVISWAELVAADQCDRFEKLHGLETVWLSSYQEKDPKKRWIWEGGFVELLETTVRGISPIVREGPRLR